MSYFANKSIVVPFDFSETAEKAIKTALEIADSSSKLHLIHVIDPTPVLISVDPAMPVPPAYDEDRRREARDKLQQLFSEGDQSRFHVACQIGDPGSEIVNFADSVNADLIVMPSHGRTGIRRLLIGSVAERVLRLASCPVLVLRDGET
jgi:nucleotide-binding universal stress UspA family protein